MSEKEIPESTEEQVQEESAELTEELEASEDNANEEVEASKETAPEIPPEKKGLMERRPSFAQSSVPNAHRGYSTNPPVVMLLIISVFVLLSVIFATAAVIN